MRQLLASLILLVLTTALAVAVTINGTVLGPDGKPVASASVIYDQHNLDGTDGTNDVRVQGTSDNAGRFTLDTGKPAATEQMSCILAAYKDGLAPGCVDPRVDEPVIHLATAVKLHGRVVDTAGQPLADVNVEFIMEIGARDGQFLPFLLWKELLSTKTNANGEWTFGMLAPDGEATLALLDRRYVYAEVRTTVGRTDAGGSLDSRQNRLDGDRAMPVARWPAYRGYLD